ncbi:hypothetical protein D3C85_1850160 [compost metagenome]
MPPAIIGTAEVTSMRAGPSDSAASMISALLVSSTPLSQPSSNRFGVAIEASGMRWSRTAIAVSSAM